MTARWDRLPPDAKVRTPRRKPAPPSTWRCEGIGGCGALLTGSVAAAERHVDQRHRAARLACMSALRSQSDTDQEATDG